MPSTAYQHPSCCVQFSRKSRSVCVVPCDKKRNPMVTAVCHCVPQNVADDICCQQNRIVSCHPNLAPRAFPATERHRSNAIAYPTSHASTNRHCNNLANSNSWQALNPRPLLGSRMTSPPTRLALSSLSVLTRFSLLLSSGYNCNKDGPGLIHSS